MTKDEAFTVSVVAGTVLMVAIVLLALFVGGCTSTNLADILVAAGKDPASVCGSVMTPYGNLKFARTNITNGDVVCNQDGLTVKSQPAVIPVGVQVVPSFSLTTPTPAPPTVPRNRVP